MCAVWILNVCECVCVCVCVNQALMFHRGMWLLQIKTELCCNNYYYYGLLDNASCTCTCRSTGGKLPHCSTLTTRM